MLDVGVKVRSKVRFIAEYSQEDRYVFAYKIIIENQSDKTIKLLSRFWRIVDANNDVRIVKGKGVVGQTPTIKPGASYDYTSNACVDTPVATMQGSFQMLDEDDRLIDVPVPMFRFALPNLVN